MPRHIILTGGCQIPGIGAAMQLLLPDDRITVFAWPELGTESKGDGHAAAFADADTWLSQAPASFMSLDQRFPGRRSFGRIPLIQFRAFHPDLSRAVRREAPTQLLLGPNGDPYCSALVYWGWKHGLNPDGVAALFRPEVFHLLGYLDLWPDAVARLSAEFARCGVPFEPFLLRMQRTGNFMLTDNHPRISALCAVAREMAVLLGAGSDIRTDPIEDCIEESLAQVVWPVYPGIAERYGLAGAYRWRCGRALVHSLNDYVRLALEAYSSEDPLDYDCSLAESSTFEEVLGARTEGRR